MSQYAIGLGSPGELHLHDRDAGTSVHIALVRGGLVKRFHVRGRDVLYLDDATYADKQKNVRGGIPLLFPSPGKLEGDEFSIEGGKGKQPQHGFLRNKEFRVAEFDADDGAVRMVTEWNRSIAFPWAGKAMMRVLLRDAVLRIEMMVTNREDTPMPFALGFHPYFAVPDAQKAVFSVAHHAEQAFDNVQKRMVRVNKNIDFTRAEVDLQLIDHPSSSMSMFMKDKLLATVRGSEDFGVWVLWSQRGKDFVCVEPWTAPANALNTGERVLRIPKDASRKLWIEIDVAS